MMELSEQTFGPFIQEDSLALVDFWAPWCGPCRAIAPALEALEEEFAGKIRFAKLNTDDHTKLANHYKIRGIPTLMMFKNGKAIRMLRGAHTQKQIASYLNYCLENF